MKYFPPVTIILIITLIAASLLMPGWANVIAGVVVVVGLSMVMYAVVQKHVRQYQGQSVNKLMTVRNILVEITGVVLAMLAAGLLGKVVSEAMTRQINDESTKLILGVLIGTLIGLGIGFLLRRAWGQLVGISPHG